MKQAVLAFVCVFGFASTVSANAGFFSGSGQTSTLTKTEQVQLVSEEVTMTPVAESVQMDRIDVRCKFVLKNLTAKPVKIQVGFPLDSQWIRRLRKDDRSEMELVLGYHFIARDEDQTYRVSCYASDSQQRFSHLFLWDMEFKPKEKRLLNIGYELPVSMALAPFRRTGISGKGGPDEAYTRVGAPSGATKPLAKPPAPPENLLPLSRTALAHLYRERRGRMVSVHHGDREFMGRAD